MAFDKMCAYHYRESLSHTQVQDTKPLEAASETRLKKLQERLEALEKAIASFADALGLSDVTSSLT